MLWIYAVPALCLFVCLPFFLHYKQLLRYRLAAAYKTLGTLCAAVPALISALRLDQHCWICFAALLLHAVADYLLEFNFYLGTGFFLAGHICYIGFFSAMYPVTAVHVISVLCLMGIIAFLIWRWRVPSGRRIPLFIVYGAVLSVTCGFALAALTAHTLPGRMTAVGGALFFISDAMLFARLLFTASHGVDWAIMISYYAAQLLFGLSCLM